ncbi:MAG: dTDP-4-amino-4,6-dideoxygalactose transaminase [Alphaproteobacteria bacterium 64-11]|nr:dTDP-4-amino-4,6-dideoxygalactose transaminase [Alphaproteobacteria bacterium]OJU10821.1 MAG: dTDP-4-amino-4,6-dideoxygalactose transaminase [Alphaproteobacteria bacterium 64-11]
MPIAFNRPNIPEKTLAYLRTGLESTIWEGDGPFTERCHAWLAAQLKAPALLTHSCTAALEMAAMLARLGPGDEVIMPSYTFVSTANAVALRGAVPVFVDIRDDTLNLDETLLEQALSARTRAIVPVHYAGMACEMTQICALAAAKGLLIIEDAAQCLMAGYQGRALGTFGQLGCLSFHVSKNVVSGEGGALIVNDSMLMERAQILREKGTNRTAYFQRKVNKYEWLDVGSSYLPGDLTAAVLLAQLEVASELTRSRLAAWRCYYAAFAEAEARGLVRRPVVPDGATPNGHIFFLRLRDGDEMRRYRAWMAGAGIPTHTHYVPLHSSPAGRKLGRTATAMTVTDRTAECLVRLPLYADIPAEDLERVIAASMGFFAGS